jgi:hypothetical protein
MKVMQASNRLYSSDVTNQMRSDTRVMTDKNPAQTLRFLIVVEYAVSLLAGAIAACVLISFTFTNPESESVSARSAWICFVGGPIAVSAVGTGAWWIAGKCLSSRIRRARNELLEMMLAIQQPAEGSTWGEFIPVDETASEVEELGNRDAMVLAASFPVRG